MTNSSEQEIKWARLVNAQSPKIYDKIHQAYKRWNQPVREYLRAETGLRMNVGEDSQSVPVTLEYGLPDHFKQALSDFENAGLEWLLLNRPKIKDSIEGLSLISEGSDLFGVDSLLNNKHIPQDKIASSIEIAKCKNTFESLLKIADDYVFTKRIFAINEDIFGMYTPYRPAVKIMWLPIAIVSMSEGIDPEALTVIVLAHELAHAYTHVGRDIDGNQWDTEDMIKADLEIVEGLAQYYTEAVCERLAPRFPKALEVFNLFLENQPECYTAYLKWFGDGERSGEVIRSALLECRAKSITSHDHLVGIIRYYTEITPTSRRKQPVLMNSG